MSIFHPFGSNTLDFLTTLNTEWRCITSYTINGILSLIVWLCEIDKHNCPVIFNIHCLIHEYVTWVLFIVTFIIKTNTCFTKLYNTYQNVLSSCMAHISVQYYFLTSVLFVHEVRFLLRVSYGILLLLLVALLDLLVSRGYQVFFSSFLLLVHPNRTNGPWREKKNIRMLFDFLDSKWQVKY